MEYGLPAVGSGIHDDPIAAPGDPLLLGKFASDREEMPHELFIFHVQVIDRLDMLVGHDQDVSRRDGMGVPKGSDLSIVVKNGGWRLARNDLAENT